LRRSTAFFSKLFGPLRESTVQGARMQLGMVGLGRMGANMTRRLMRGGHTLVVSDLSSAAVKGLAGEEEDTVPSAARPLPAAGLRSEATSVWPPRAAWIMVPSGDATEKTV